MIALDSTRKLQRRVVAFATAGIVTAAISVSLAVGVPAYLEDKRDNERQLVFATQSKARAIANLLAEFRSIAKQVTSRTRMREQLVAFNRGEVPLEELVRFQGTALGDPLRQSADMAGIVRLDKNARKVAAVGVSVPDTQWIVPPDTAEEPVLYGPVDIDASPLLVVAAPIRTRENERAGTDIVTFRVSRLQEEINDQEELWRTERTFAGHYRDGRLRLIHDSLLNDPDAEPPELSSIARAFTKGVAGERGMLSPSSSSGTPSVIGYATVQGIDWVVFLAVHRSELYESTTRKIFLVSTITLLLTGVCIYGTRRLMRPVTDRLMTLTAERELLLENTADIIYRHDRSGAFTYLSPSVEGLLGIPASACTDKFNTFCPADPGQPECREFTRQALDTGETQPPFSAAVARRNGPPIMLEFNERPYFEGGEVAGIIGTARDITAREQAEERVRESEERMRLLTDALPVLIVLVDRELRFKFVNATCSRWYARPKDMIVGRKIDEFHSEASAVKLRRYWESVLSGESVHFEESLICPDGVTRQVRGVYIPHWGKENKAQGFFGLVEDITERKSMEAQLQQAQKMEAVGQLTGGIAHDFNNLLAVILGNLELLERGVGDEPRVRKRLKTAIDATFRGADLTQRLLAFSRRQTLEPKVVDINELVDDMHELLHRTLGETVELETALAENLGPTLVDPAQLENALLNLAINARDAMPKGGKLTVETARVWLDEAYVANHPYVVPGQYVMAAVTDTGSGMPPDIVEQVFDPFFTTKDVGKGTGLGLSMVYGFVKQSKGHVHIYSEPGHGTTVKIYLPERTEVRHESEEQPISESADKGTETILVVEDDAGVREVAVDYLKGLGYRVLEAESGPAALALIDQQPEGQRIDLLFSDVIMPGGLTGPELAEKIRERCLGVKVLFASGYPRNAFERFGLEEFDAPLMTKPYHNKELAEKARKALNT